MGTVLSTGESFRTGRRISRENGLGAAHMAQTNQEEAQRLVLLLFVI
jgi:hypothetical protein